MDGEDAGREEIAVVAGEETSDQTESDATSIRDQVTEILAVIASVTQLGDYRRTHRRECGVLVRRMKLLLPFLEEVRDLDAPTTEKSLEFTRNLKKVFLLARKLLKACNGGSKIYLAVESEAIVIRFHSVYEKLLQVFFDVPFEDLGISDEVKEQVELLSTQLRRANRRTDTQDIELAVDLMVAFSKTNQRNADTAILERIAKKLELNTVEDLKTETIAVKNLVHEKSGLNAETAQQIIDLLNKFKQLLGVEASNILEDPIMPKTLKKSTSLVIPHEFLCPITLEIMTDPVIIASGQTYERESIQKWVGAGHMTCPKTRQTLAHLSLASNYALKNLIMQWCEGNNFKLPEREIPSCSENPSTDPNEEVLSVVKDLSSSNLETQRKAVKRIRMLAKENPENRVLIADSGGIPPLMQLLSYPDSKIQENAVTALLNLSIDDKSKKLISSGGAIPAIIEILKNGAIEAKENSAAALFSLSMLDEIKATVGSLNGIPPLVKLLQKGTIRGKRDALTALFSLSLNSANKGRAIDAGIVSPLLQILEDRNLGLIDEALSVFLLLACHPKGRDAIGQLGFIETLVGFIKQGTPRNKECATSVLLELGTNNSSFILSALQFGVYEHLVEISRCGTNRGQRKANALMELISKSEQIP